PVFVDVDETTQTMSPEALARAITPKTRAVVPVHLYGTPADVPALARAAGGLPIVEDAAQAHGAKLAEGAVGALGTLPCFSFYPSKNLGAFGDGGAITTASPELAAKVRMLRNGG